MASSPSPPDWMDGSSGEIVQNLINCHPDDARLVGNSARGNRVNQSRKEREGGKEGEGEKKGCFPLGVSTIGSGAIGREHSHKNTCALHALEMHWQRFTYGRWSD